MYRKIIIYDINNTDFTKSNIKIFGIPIYNFLIFKH